MFNHKAFQKRRLEHFLRSPKTIRHLQKLVQKDGVTMTDDDIKDIIDKFMSSTEA